MTVESPCRGQCGMGGHQHCRGCGRTLREIAAWAGASDPERLAILRSLEMRASQQQGSTLCCMDRVEQQRMIEHSEEFMRGVESASACRRAPNVPGRPGHMGFDTQGRTILPHIMTNDETDELNRAKLALEKRSGTTERTERKDVPAPQPVPQYPIEVEHRLKSLAERFGDLTYAQVRCVGEMLAHEVRQAALPKGVSMMIENDAWRLCVTESLVKVLATFARIRDEEDEQKIARTISQPQETFP